MNDKNSQLIVTQGLTPKLRLCLQSEGVWNFRGIITAWKQQMDICSGLLALETEFEHDQGTQQKYHNAVTIYLSID